MCDYSLARLPNRLAAEGEQLVVYGFKTGLTLAFLFATSVETDCPLFCG
jgi:hypothetical protein